MTGEYSCVRPTRRWPFRLFMEMIHIAALNSYILWVQKYPDWKKNDRSRRKQFIRVLSTELAKENVGKRKNSAVKFHRQQQDAFALYLSSSDAAISTTSPTPMETAAPATSSNIYKTGCCRFCSEHRKTRIFCEKCKKPVCTVHRTEKRRSGAQIVQNSNRITIYVHLSFFDLLFKFLEVYIDKVHCM